MIIGTGVSGSILRSCQGLVKVKGSSPGVDSVTATTVEVGPLVGKVEKFSEETDNCFGSSNSGEKLGPEISDSNFKKSSF